LIKLFLSNLKIIFGIFKKFIKNIKRNQNLFLNDNNKKIYLFCLKYFKNNIEKENFKNAK
jgi:hypothetical protein